MGVRDWIFRCGPVLAAACTRWHAPQPISRTTHLVLQRLVARFVPMQRAITVR
jgi:hypothetical protein